jgi:hypothetical protein
MDRFSTFDGKNNRAPANVQDFNSRRASNVNENVTLNSKALMHDLDSRFENQDRMINYVI